MELGLWTDAGLFIAVYLDFLLKMSHTMWHDINSDKVILII